MIISNPKRKFFLNRGKQNPHLQVSSFLVLSKIFFFLNTIMFCDITTEMTTTILLWVKFFTEYEILIEWGLVDNLLITATTLKMDVAIPSENSITKFRSIRFHILKRFYLQQ